ncbi:MAG TPA: hypothetical protein VLI72_09255 [Methylibium sp.]|nr:hypothetical protein [Methylibium sp.]
MLIAGRPKPNGQPLTHLGYLQACQLAERACLRPCVQVRKRFGGEAVVLCARVVEIDAGSSDGEWFKVETALGALWVESRHVRLCSGDGRCTCETALGCWPIQKKCPAPGTATRCETSRLERRPAASIATA